MHDYNFRNRLLKTGHYVGLKFQEGWFFAHVLETEYIELKPWILMNENDERDAIAGETAGSEDDEILDHVERQLVTPRDNEQNLIFQLFTGIAPSRMQIYPFFGRDRSPNLTGGATPESHQVPLSGYDSPYNNPTAQSELVTVNSMDDLALQAYNPMDEESEARVSFHVNKIHYAAVEDPNVMRGFIQGQIPFRDHPMGLAAQKNEQLRAPGWMKSRFGDLIKSTSEIIEESDGTASPNGSGMSIGDRIPSQSNNGGE